MVRLRRRRYEKLVPTVRIVLEVYVPGLTRDEKNELYQRVNEVWRDWRVAHHDGRWNLVNTEASMRNDL